MKFLEKANVVQIPATSVILFFSGLIFGLVLCFFIMGAGARNNERVVAFEEAAAATAIRQIAESVSTSSSPEYGKAYETITAQDPYDGQAFAASMPIESEAVWTSWMNTQRKESAAFLKRRWEYSQEFIHSGELKRDADVRAFLLSPREHFVRERNKGHEYDDTWMPIGYGATITDPDVVAMMTSTLNIEAQDKVLEIGTGSGYQSTILSFLSKNTFTIEIIKPLFVETNQLYNDLTENYPSLGSISRKLGDGYYGWEKYAPFNKIIVTCAIDHIPPPLLQQLAPGGIMVLPLGPPGRQYIMEVRKNIDEQGNITLTRRDVYNGLRVSFIPFRDEKGTSYSTSEPAKN